jgi:uncharacterized protein YbjQ (UPF0145 family)
MADTPLTPIEYASRYAAPTAATGLLLTNTESLPGHRVRQVLGLVQGNTVRAKHVGRDIMASLKNIVGGELRGYTELLVEARGEATARMVAQAQQLGANAVVNVRYSTSAVTGGAAELYAYGTAVVLEAETTTTPEAA